MLEKHGVGFLPVFYAPIGKYFVYFGIVYTALVFKKRHIIFPHAEFRAGLKQNGAVGQNNVANAFFSERRYRQNVHHVFRVEFYAYRGILEAFICVFYNRNGKQHKLLAGAVYSHNAALIAFEKFVKTSSEFQLFDIPRQS